MEKFQKMSECMSQYPDLYPDNIDDDDDDEIKTMSSTVDEEKLDQVESKKS